MPTPLTPTPASAGAMLAVLEPFCGEIPNVADGNSYGFYSDDHWVIFMDDTVNGGDQPALRLMVCKATVPGSHVALTLETRMYTDLQRARADFLVYLARYMPTANALFWQIALQRARVASDDLSRITSPHAVDNPPRIETDAERDARILKAVRELAATFGPPVLMRLRASIPMPMKRAVTAADIQASATARRFA